MAGAGLLLAEQRREHLLRIISGAFLVGGFLEKLIELREVFVAPYFMNVLDHCSTIQINEKRFTRLIRAIKPKIPFFSKYIHMSIKAFAKPDLPNRRFADISCANVRWRIATSFLYYWKLYWWNPARMTSIRRLQNQKPPWKWLRLSKNGFIFICSVWYWEPKIWPNECYINFLKVKFAFSFPQLEWQKWHHF